MSRTTSQPHWKELRGSHGRSALIEASRRGQFDGQRWVIGAAGEQRTGNHLQRLERRWWRPAKAAVLADRSIPGSRANIDHLVVTRNGMWVVDTKVWAGRPERTRDDLIVGGRSTRDAVRRIGWMGKRVAQVLHHAGVGDIPVRCAVVIDSLPMLWMACWPEGCAGSRWQVRRLLGAPGPHTAHLDEIANLVALAFPPHR